MVNGPHKGLPWLLITKDTLFSVWNSKFLKDGFISIFLAPTTGTEETCRMSAELLNTHLAGKRGNVRVSQGPIW